MRDTHYQLQQYLLDINCFLQKESIKSRFETGCGFRTRQFSAHENSGYLRFRGFRKYRIELQEAETNL
ncbi:MULTISPECIES: hypothetical protein [Ruegeria]|uniref:Uncharacterized protein n=1 Tax=Ruegeria atlantica TaxID=81569 RepID=A0ABX1W528_9RHOB|nr:MULTISPECIES: hypothetical protein [Ruegeria]NOD29026.1 hypothetical protein [Ruegeria atlantica]